MIDQNRKTQAARNVKQYLEEGLLKKEHNETALDMYRRNATTSLRVAERLFNDQEAYLWVVVCSYYAMFYSANAVLLRLGYRTSEKIAHNVTSEALIVFVLGKLTKQLLEDYENARDDALAVARAEDVIENYERERGKRGLFQYSMTEEVQAQKAKTSFERAKQFVFAMQKLLVE